ncbi:MAG: hypothetical protein H6839_09210 [Planctomycetes bacterium]|nr:hypothetical protein [Planctomycetota bacterium]
MRAVIAAILLLLAVPASAANLAFNLSGTTGPDFGNQLNDTDVEVARFVLQPTGGSVDIDSITVHISNFGLADEAFTRVRAFFDADGNGTFDALEELDETSTIVPNGTTDDITFTETFTAPGGVIRTLQLRVDIGTNPVVYGESYNFSIDPQADIVLTNPGTDTITSSAVATSNDISIRHSENQLAPGTGNPSAPRNAYYGKTNAPALQFAVSSLTPTGPGQLQGIDLASITISVTCANSAQTAAVTRLTLWQDDGDSAFEPGSGEVLILSHIPTDVGKWVIAGSVISVTFDGSPIQTLTDIPSGSARTFWVGIDFGSGTNATVEVSIVRTDVLGALGAAADFFVTSPNLISGDVINLSKSPPKPKSKEAEGEGGCSTTDDSGLLFLSAVLAGFVVIAQNLWRKKMRPQSTTN